MRSDAFWLTRRLLYLRDKNRSAVDRTHKDCAKLRTKLRRRADLCQKILDRVHPVEKRIAQAALEFSGYDANVDRLLALNRELSKELAAWKRSADETERAYEQDLDELLKENDELKETIRDLHGAYDTLYNLIHYFADRAGGEPDQVSPEEAPADR